MVALVDGQPRTLNLKQVLEAFISHRRDVVTRRTVFDLKKARQKAHLLEGLGIALANIDEVIALIKAAKTPAIAKEKLLEKAWQPGLVADLLSRLDGNLCRPETLAPEFGLHTDGYHLSPEQAQAILELRLHRLTALEQDKILEQYQDLLALIESLLSILKDPDKLMQVIRDELVKVKEDFGDERRTEIIAAQEDLTHADLIPEEDVVVTLSHEGYVKYQALELYRAQHRGGRGKTATRVKEEDFIDKLWITNTHDTILCFSTLGKVYWMNVYQLPQASRTSRGKPIVNLLPLSEGERITFMLPIREYRDDQFVVMATSTGTIKKTALTNFSRPRASGIIAIELLEEDKLIGVELTHGNDEIMLFTDAGKAIRFDETDVRPMGRTARGVRGVKLQADQKVIALSVPKAGAAVLIATENGFGKRTALDEFRQTGRGGQGVISIQTTDRNGKVVMAVQVFDNDEAMFITNNGTLVRIPVEEVSIIGRNTQGVRLINLAQGEQLVSFQRIEENIDDAAEDNPDEDA